MREDDLLQLAAIELIDHVMQLAHRIAHGVQFVVGNLDTPHSRDSPFAVSVVVETLRRRPDMTDAYRTLNATFASEHTSSFRPSCWIRRGFPKPRSSEPQICASSI